MLLRFRYPEVVWQLIILIVTTHFVIASVAKQSGGVESIVTNTPHPRLPRPDYIGTRNDIKQAGLQRTHATFNDQPYPSYPQDGSF